METKTFPESASVRLQEWQQDRFGLLRVLKTYQTRGGFYMGGIRIQDLPLVGSEFSPLSQSQWLFYFGKTKTSPDLLELYVYIILYKVFKGKKKLYSGRLGSNEFILRKPKHISVYRRHGPKLLHQIENQLDLIAMWFLCVVSRG